MFDHPDFDHHEKILEVDDPDTGLKAIIAIHSTAMGPAAGGCRLWTYDSFGDARRDALRLSRGMSYKNAMADLPLGGGKAVILGPVHSEDRTALFRAFGRAVDSLGGHYITAEDVGVGVADMQIVATQTRFVSGLASGAGGVGGDPSPFTARGVRVGIEAAVRTRLGRENLTGVRVAVQGLGGVGGHLCQELHERGARLIVADINPDRVALMQSRYQADIAAVDTILCQDADVIAPCALGGAISENVAARLKAPIVAGGANNQLLTSKAGEILADRDILYAPDYVINGGGIIMVSGEYLGGQTLDGVLAQVDAIGPRLEGIFAAAKRDGRTTQDVVDVMARAKLTAARQIKIQKAELV
ncbi:MAG: amino acid dehydrogenase [Asticcacaulis sp. 32-58-5]|nr:MAG: amino acid dehydrogenase [Asticcacaulis sp. 32-58-5]